MKSLPEIAKANEFRFFTLAEMTEILGVGRGAMTALASAGAPIVARKMNPRLLMKWLAENPEIVRKVRK